MYLYSDTRRIIRESLEDLNIALDINPLDLEVLHSRGIIYYRLDHNEESLVYFNRVLDIDPSFARSCTYLEAMKQFFKACIKNQMIHHSLKFFHIILHIPILCLETSF